MFPAKALGSYIRAEKFQVAACAGRGQCNACGLTITLFISKGCFIVYGLSYMVVARLPLARRRICPCYAERSP